MKKEIEADLEVLEELIRMKKEIEADLEVLHEVAYWGR